MPLNLAVQRTPAAVFCLIRSVAAGSAGLGREASGSRAGVGRWHPRIALDAT